MKGNSFFNQQSIQNIKKMHKGFLWVASGIIVVSLVLGGVLIFVDSDAAVFARVQATLTVVALAAFICVNNFIRIEKGNKLIQGFALTGLVANVVWLVLAVLMIWGVLSPVQVVTNTPSTRTENATVRTYNYRNNYTTLDSDYDYEEEYDDYDEEYDEDYDEDYDYYDYYDDYDDYDYDEEYDDVVDDILTPTSYSYTTTEVAVVTRILIVALSVASIGFWVSNVLAIKERVNVVKMLKIVAVACEIVGSSFVIVLAFAWPIAFDKTTLNMIQLYGLTVSGFIMTALAAWIISITHKDFEPASTDGKILEVKPVDEEAKIDEQPTVIEETHIEDESVIDEGNRFEDGAPMEENSQPEGEAPVVEMSQTEEGPQVENAEPEMENSHFGGFSDNNNN